MNQVEKDTAAHIKEQRKLIDVLVNTIDLRRETDDDQIELPLVLAGIAAKDAFMWLGKASKFLGSENPYPASTNPSNTTVEPAQDRKNGVLFDDIEDPIIWLKSVRQNIDEIELHLKTNLAMLNDPSHKFYQISAAHAWVRLNDCKHSLGLAMRKVANLLAEVEAEKVEADVNADLDAKKDIDQNDNGGNDLEKANPAAGTDLGGEMSISKSNEESAGPAAADATKGANEGELVDTEKKDEAPSGEIIEPPATTKVEEPAKAPDAPAPQKGKSKGKGK